MGNAKIKNYKIKKEIRSGTIKKSGIKGSKT